MTKETTKTEKPKTKGSEGFNLEAAIADYSENTTIQQNGIRHADKAFVTRRLKDVHGVDMDAVQKYHDAMLDERSAIAEVTALDLTNTVTELRRSEDHEEAVKAATASTSFWQVRGTETLSVISCDESGDTTIDEGGNVVPVTKHGRIRTTIEGHDGIRRKTVDDVAAKIAGLFA